MSNNKSTRQHLERVYGKECMFKRAKIEERVEQLRTIKTYKKFLEEKRYTGKKLRRLENNMTFHHLKHRSEGGKTNIENGAIVNELAHRYMHSLPRRDEEIINNMLREFKLNYVVGEEYGTVDLSLGEDYIEISLQQKPKRKYNRAKAKEELRERIEEELWRN